MKQRMAISAFAGMLVAAFWAVLFLSVQVTPADSLTWTLARISCPVVFLGSALHVGVRVPWAVLANGITYALAAAAWDSLQQVFKPVKQPADHTTGT